MGGGKLQVLLGSLPRSGAHALAPRDGNAGPKTAMSVMQPQGKDYDSLADSAAESQVPGIGNLSKGAGVWGPVHLAMQSQVCSLAVSSGWPQLQGVATC